MAAVGSDLGCGEARGVVGMGMQVGTGVGVRVLGVRVDAWTMKETSDAIIERMERGLFTQHVVINVAKLVDMRRNEALARAVNQCEIVSIDGMGVVWGARALGVTVPERVAGIDLFLELLGAAERRGYSVFLLGAREDVLAECVKRIQGRFPRLMVAGSHHGYFWDDEEGMVGVIRASGADMLFVGISSPKKEEFVGKWRERLGVRFVMGVGGSLDVVAGRTRRAPGWMQKAGLEWFFRLVQEPRRMWKRYLVTNAVFAWLLVREFGGKVLAGAGVGRRA